MPVSLEYMSWLQALGLFALLATPVVLLGIRSLVGLGPIRRWVAVGARLAVLLLMVLILAGARWQKINKTVDVMVLRDVSDSTLNVKSFPGETLQRSVEDYLKAASDPKLKKPDDRIGVISFHSQSLIDAIPNTTLALDARPIRDLGNGTDVASAIQLGLATLGKDAMHRMLLVWDGNSSSGDIEQAISAATSAGVPIDVMPLKYDVQSEVLLERFVAPTWKRENEPFTIDVYLRSTNIAPVTGKLTVLHQGVPMDLDPDTPGMQAGRLITLKNGQNRERVRVAALQSAGVHRFEANFEAPNVTASVGGSVSGSGGGSGSATPQAGDTLTQNNVGSAFTFVRGKGKVLYIDNVPDGGGQALRNALIDEGINVEAGRSSVDQFPNDIVELQNYDAIVLANVPRGQGGLSEDQQKMLAAYVHDMGGGLVMIGGEDAFGAGGWQGSRLEEVLPVNMDVPAQRQVPKGALVLAMHSCEMPNGNYWGEQCAIKASETLSTRDEIGVLSYAWQGPGGGGSQWDFPLQQKGDGSKVTAAIKKMQLGDMPSFDDMLNVAINGRDGNPGLKQSDARQKHIIVISDGDPQSPRPDLIEDCIKNKISITTITVFPHMGDPDGLPPTMKDMALKTKGRSYGPINANPSQLPQIFIKEASVVRRSLIYEEKAGIPLKLSDAASELIKGLPNFAPVYGMVLTSRKANPQIEVPLVAGKNNDPLLASWQSGLGRSAVFTSDAHNKWLAGWIGGATYNKFWSQVVRAVARPPMSSDFEVNTVQVSGNKGRITVEALGKDNAFLNFLSITANMVGPNPNDSPKQVRLTQTGPGTYVGEFEASDPGNYVAVLNYRGARQNQGGMLLSGMVVNTSPELRDLKSNEAAIERIRAATGGRLVTPFNAATANLFTRDGLRPSVSPQPIWDRLLYVLLAMILIDVAIRRIAWDWLSTKQMAYKGVDWVKSFTTTRKVESRQTLEALQRVRSEQAPHKPGASAPDGSVASASKTTEAIPDRTKKFEAPAGVEGDITSVVGGATNKAIPSAPKQTEPVKGASGTGDAMTGLLAAKKRAREQMEKKDD